MFLLELDDLGRLTSNCYISNQDILSPRHAPIKGPFAAVLPQCSENHEEIEESQTNRATSHLLSGQRAFAEVGQELMKIHPQLAVASGFSPTPRRLDVEPFGQTLAKSHLWDAWPSCSCRLFELCRLWMLVAFYNQQSVCNYVCPYMDWTWLNHGERGPHSLETSAVFREELVFRLLQNWWCPWYRPKVPSKLLGIA